MATYYVRAPKGASDREILQKAGMPDAVFYRISVKEDGSAMTPMGEKVFYGTPSDCNIYEVNVNR